MVLVFTGTTFAQGPMFRKGWCFGCIDLSPKQIHSLWDLKEDFLKECVPLQKEIFKKRLELKELLLEPSPDAKKVTQKQDEILDLMRDLAKKRISYQLKARKILTPEQLEKLPPQCMLNIWNMKRNFLGYRGINRGYIGRPPLLW